MEYKRYVQRNNQYLGFSDSDDEKFYMIVFDVSSLEEDELTIELLGENKLKVTFKHGFHDYGNLSFSRDCLYVYTLPETVQLTNLVAYWSGDNFLVIKEKKNCAIEKANKFSGNTDVQNSKFDETINSTAADENRAMKKGIIPLNESSELGENITKERKSSNSSREHEEIVHQEMKSIKVLGEREEKMMRESKSMSAAGNSEEKVMKEIISENAVSKSEEKILEEMISKNAESKSEEKILKEMISKNAESKSEEKILKEMISKNAESKSEEKILKEMISKSAAGKIEEKIVQETKSESASSENNENLIQIQDDKSRNTSNTVQTGSRLIPIRVPCLFNHTLAESNLQAAMNDIKKRIASINDFLDKHHF